MLTRKQKEKWIAALRSGNYKQGTGKLYDSETDAYCCLGVLANECRLLPKKVMDGRAFLLDKPYRKIANLIGDLEMRYLVRKNDGNWKTGAQNYPFPEIADYVEKILPAK